MWVVSPLESRCANHLKHASLWGQRSRILIKVNVKLNAMLQNEALALPFSELIFRRCLRSLTGQWPLHIFCSALSQALKSYNKKCSFKPLKLSQMDPHIKLSQWSYPFQQACQGSNLWTTGKRTIKMPLWTTLKKN